MKIKVGQISLRKNVILIFCLCPCPLACPPIQVEYGNRLWVQLMNLYSTLILGKGLMQSPCRRDHCSKNHLSSLYINTHLHQEYYAKCMADQGLWGWSQRWHQHLHWEQLEGKEGGQRLHAALFFVLLNNSDKFDAELAQDLFLHAHFYISLGENTEYWAVGKSEIENTPRNENSRENSRLVHRTALELYSCFV